MPDYASSQSLADVVRRQSRDCAGAIALVFGDRRQTYGELDARASRVGQRLRQEWAPPQSRIAILAKNSDCFYEIWFGALKARVVLTPINTRLAAPEIAYVLNDSQAEILFVGGDFRELAEKATAGLARKPKLIALDVPHADWPLYEAWRDEAEPIDPVMEARRDDVCIQLYTSGTTGHPKGVELSNDSYLAFVGFTDDVQGFSYRPGETVLNAMPLFHVAGTNIGLAGLAQGARVVVLGDLVPSIILDLIGREKVNHAFFVPAVILSLLNAPEMAAADLTSMRTVSYGASPISEDVLLRARERFGCDFLQFYGMTETTGAGTYLPPQAHDPAAGKLRSCGIPWPGVEVKVVDASMQEVATGEVGEVVIRAPIVMKGYFNRPDATAEAVTDGWMHTGDAAYKDADGYFFIYDRVKDMIVTGGENVYPAEVENAIFGCPGVADAAVIGVPDEKWGEAVKALVVLHPGAETRAEEIIAWVRERVAAYKAPKTVDFIEAIPRNPSGKVLRRELRKPYWEGRTRMVG